MHESIFYTPVDAVQIKGFTLPDIQGVRAKMLTAPFRDGHVPQFSLMVRDTDPLLPEDNPPLRRISHIHGRSFEFVLGQNNAVTWADEYGNLFMNLNTKGNNGSDPHVFKSSLSPSGFMIYGMQESDTMVRVLKASELLRSHNVDTEAIVKVIEPAELPINGEFIPTAEFKRELIKKVWENDGRSISPSTDFRPPDRKDIPAISKAFEKMVFYITVRGTQVNDRLADLFEARNTPDAAIILGNAFLYVNQFERIKAATDPEYEAKTFSADSQDDINDYFNEYLPQRLGQNFARIHKLDLVVDYPHTGNWSTVGSFYDLDSVKGEPLGLGDKPVALEDIVEDVNRFIQPRGKTGFGSPEEIAESFVSGKNTFRDSFIRAYIEESGWTDSVLGFSAIRMLLTKLEDSASQEVMESYMDPIVKRMDLQPAMDALTQRFIVDNQAETLEEIDYSDRGMVTVAFEKAGIKGIMDGIVSEVTQKYGKLPTELTPDDIAGIHLFSMAYTVKEAVKVFSSTFDMPAELFTKLFSGHVRQSVALIESYKYQTYQNLAKYAGWEDDIGQHIDKIVDLFGDFESIHGLDHIDHYTSLIREQLGLELNLDVSDDDMIKMFHVADDANTRKFIEDALANAPEDADRNKTIHLAFESKEGQARFTFNHIGRYVAFVIEYVNSQFTQSKPSEIAELKTRYGEQNGELVVRLMEQFAVSPFIEEMPEEIEKRLDKDSSERLNGIINSYLIVA